MYDKKDRYVEEPKRHSYLVILDDESRFYIAIQHIDDFNPENETPSETKMRIMGNTANKEINFCF